MLTIERTTLLHPHSVSSARVTERLVYIDNLRTTAITMVIVHHAAQAYGPTSGSWPISNTTQAAILGPFFIVNVSFGLALLFLLAGYFVPPAYDRRGTRGFLINRFMRLAVPLMIIVLVLLIINWLMYGHKQPVGDFLANELRHLNLGHMWFVAHLMVYSCLYSG